MVLPSMLIYKSALIERLIQEGTEVSESLEFDIHDYELGMHTS